MGMGAAGPGTPGRLLYTESGQPCAGASARSVGGREHSGASKTFTVWVAQVIQREFHHREDTAI